MMKTSTTPLMLEKQKLIAAPIEKVYECWTQEKHMKRWVGCGTTENVNIKLDFRIGGTFSYECIMSDGAVVTMSGEYKEIEPNKKVVYTWTNNSQEYAARDTLVTVEFVAIDKNSTKILLTHANFANEHLVEGHAMGWGAALEKFKELFRAA